MAYNEEKDYYICAVGKKMLLKGTKSKNNLKIDNSCMANIN